MNGEKIIKSFQSIYGAEKGLRIYENVMPGIVADFMKMIAAAKPGETVFEEYILEDQKAALHLSGRSEKGKPEITADIRRL